MIPNAARPVVMKYRETNDFESNSIATARTQMQNFENKVDKNCFHAMLRTLYGHPDATIASDLLDAFPLPFCPQKRRVRRTHPLQ